MNNIDNVISAFLGNAKVEYIAPIGNGHINSTFLFKTPQAKYVLQKINTSVLPDVDGLMSNIDKVTRHIQKKVAEAGRDPSRATLNFLTAKNGKKYVEVESGAYRMYDYVDGTFTIEKMDNPMHFYYSGKAFGEFARFLTDFDASLLVETIKDFHNTPKRFEAFEKSISENIKGRVAYVCDEIEFVKSRRDFMSLFTDKLASNDLPLRVTHNDTKLNNVLFDKKTNMPIAVIDLDTVMPGSYLYDFGDAIRSGSTHAAEDEKALKLVDFDLELYRSFAKGYIEESKDSLTDEEINMLPYASIMLTLECGMRFLTDHLNGDTYFRISREGHNLDRARTQFKLVSEMENNVENMKEIIDELAGR